MARHPPCTVWVVQTLLVQSLAFVQPCKKSRKNSWCCISVVSLHKVMHSRKTLRGKQKWKERFHLWKRPINSKQSKPSNPTWNEKYQWTACSVGTLGSAKQKSPFVLHSKRFKTGCKLQFLCPPHCLQRNTAIHSPTDSPATPSK